MRKCEKLELQVVKDAPGIILLCILVSLLATTARPLVEVLAAGWTDALAIFTAMKTLWKR